MPIAPTRGVPHRKTGKIVVACNDNEIEQLGKIYKQAQINGCENLELIDAAAVKKLEPEVFCLGAMNSPETGVIDSHSYMLALRGEIEDHGGAIALNTRIERLVKVPGGWEVHFGAGETIVVDAVINSAGLGAQTLARATEGYPQERVPKLALAKGNYFSYAGRPVFKRLVYPTPVPGGLGTHVVLDLAGRMRFGPDVEWIERENYDVDPSRAQAFYASIRKYWPGLPDNSLVPDYAGIRPKISAQGEPQQDFIIDAPERPRRAAAGDAVRDRIAGTDGVAVDRRRGRDLSVELNAAVVLVCVAGALAHGLRRYRRGVVRHDPGLREPLPQLSR